MDVPLVFVQGAVEGAASIVADRLSGAGRKETLPVEVRYQAYRHLRGTVLQVVYGVDIVSEVRLAVSGAIWSWTIVFPAWRSLTSNLRELAVEFTEVVCVGTPQVVEAAVAVADALQHLTNGLRGPTGLDSWLWRTPVLVRGSHYLEDREAVLKALRRFMVVSTEDLAVKRRAAVPAAPPGQPPLAT